MKLVVVSDLHGDLPGEIPDGDMLILPGDITPHMRSPAHEAAWFNTVFNPWLDALPHRHKVMIAGNHDFVMRDHLGLLEINGHAIYLQDSSVTIEGLNIHGSPWSCQFGDWAFMASEERLAWYFSIIPPQTDVLVVHGPPHGLHDAVPPRYVGGEVEMCGSKSLLDRIFQLERLKLCCFGHIHEGYGVSELRGTKFVNASHYDGNMRYTNPPVVIDL